LRQAQSIAGCLVLFAGALEEVAEGEEAVVLAGAYAARVFVVLSAEGEEAGGEEAGGAFAASFVGAFVEHTDTSGVELVAWIVGIEVHLSGDTGTSDTVRAHWTVA
jgi:hypothetical protein